MTTKILIKHSWNKIRYYLSFVLFGFYIVVGGMFLFSDIWADLLPKGRSIVGIILILFGVLRFYIAYRRYVNKHAKIQILKAKKENEQPK
jgi:uncharacterized membrane protein YidH (DUF202 family)